MEPLAGSISGFLQTTRRHLRSNFPQVCEGIALLLVISGPNPDVHMKRCTLFTSVSSCFTAGSLFLPHQRQKVVLPIWRPQIRAVEASAGGLSSIHPSRPLSYRYRESFCAEKSLFLLRIYILYPITFTTRLVSTAMRVCVCVRDRWMQVFLCVCGGSFYWSSYE